MTEWLVVRRVQPNRGDRRRDAAPIAKTATSSRPPSEITNRVALEQAPSRAQLPNPNEIGMVAGPMPVSLIAPLVIEAKTADGVLRDAKAAGAAWGLKMLGVDPKRFNGAGGRVASVARGKRRDLRAFANGRGAKDEPVFP